MLATWPWQRTKTVRVFDRGDIPTQSDGPTRTTEMAGFFMAHAVWCVSSGDALQPLIGYEDHAGWTLMRFLDRRLEAGVERAERWIERNPKHVVRATLVFDGHFIGGEEHTDALGARIVEYGPKPWRAKITLPYRRAD